MLTRKNVKLRRGPVRRRSVAAQSGSRTAYSPKDRNRYVQLLVSSVVFVLLVGVKLLLPEQLAQVSGPVSDALGKNMDVAEVFSVVSRGFSGGNGSLGDSWDDLCEAVFGPGEAAAGKTVSVVPRDLLKDMRVFADGGTGAYEWIPTRGSYVDAEQEPGGDIVRILYPAEDYPANTEPEQVVLGFDYLAPVRGTVSSEFGHRKDPLAGGERFHYGIDLTADAGTPITAFADGVVTVTGESSSYGKYLILSHDSGCTTLYAHCSEISVVSGKSVSKGDCIAAVGDTGQATGPHLHFELQRDGIYLNPIYYVA